MAGAAAGEMLIPFGMGLWTGAWRPGFLVASASAITLCAGASAALVFICPLMVEAAMSHSRSGFGYAPAFYLFASWLTATSLVLCGISPTLPDRALGEDTHDRMTKSNQNGGGKYDKVESDESVDVLDAEEIGPKESEQDTTSGRFKREHVVAITALVLGLYVGVETGFGGYLLYFAHEECDLSQRDGQYITSVYWGSLAFGHCIEGRRWGETAPAS